MGKFEKFDQLRIPWRSNLEYFLECCEKYLKRLTIPTITNENPETFGANAVLNVEAFDRWFFSIALKPRTGFRKISEHLYKSLEIFTYRKS